VGAHTQDERGRRRPPFVIPGLAPGIDVLDFPPIDAGKVIDARARPAVTANVFWIERSGTIASFSS
jgi:hypothetical protein